ncbi:MAG: hypothetical protein FJ096_22860 [Deltaproteobacteria bacterium]|nr:hypothetical protein [Deltaproteobacteria bacterium]
MTDDNKAQVDSTRSYPDGRSLQFGVVGLGQCGGNFAEAFASLGYPALAINISRADLRGLTGLAEDQKLVIGEEGFYGAGGSLSIGGEALRASQGKIDQATVALLDDVEVLLVVGALGGGTGGNLAELVNLLAAQEFPVLALGVLPSASEGHRTKTNALWALNELVDSAAEAILLIDNDKLFAVGSGANAVRFMNDCNLAFVRSFDALNCLAGRESLRPLRTFDPNDLRQVMRFGGVTVFGAERVQGDLTSESLVAAFRDALSRNELLAGGFETQDAVMVASVLTANESTLADVSSREFDEYLREIKKLTSGAAHRTGLYVGNGPATLHVMVAGLPLPSRATEMLDEAATEMRAFGDKKVAARSKLKKLDLSALGIVPVVVPSQPPSGPAPRSEESPSRTEAQRSRPTEEAPLEEEAAHEEEASEASGNRPEGRSRPPADSERGRSADSADSEDDESERYDG